MQFLRSGGGGGGGGFGGAAWEAVRRHFSRKRSVDVRRINPKVPKEEAVAISGRLLQILSDHGPLTVGSTWNHAKVQKQQHATGIPPSTYYSYVVTFARKSPRLLSLLPVNQSQQRAGDMM
jgi:hypothetical protein